jgi:hypothetical protein
MSDNVIELNDVKVNASIKDIITIAYSKLDGLSIEVGKKVLHEKAQITFGTYGVGKIRLGTLEEHFYLTNGQMKDFAQKIKLGDAELLGVELEVYPDGTGNIAAEGQIKRNVGDVIEVGAGGTIVFNIFNALKIIPGMKRTMNILDAKKSQARNLGYADCVMMAATPEAQCKQKYGFH